MPAELEENILSLLSEQDRPEHKKIASKPVIPLLYKVAAAAALLLAFIWVIDPGGIFSPVTMSTTFVPMVQKEGKGPKKGDRSEAMSTAERDVQMVKNLIYKYNGSLIEEKHEAVPDSILQLKAVIKEADYADFTREYNRISSAGLTEHIRFSFRKEVVIKISFPGRAANGLKDNF